MARIKQSADSFEPGSDPSAADRASEEPPTPLSSESHADEEYVSWSGEVLQVP